MPRALSICVFCSSSSRIDQRFFDAADDLGMLIATKGHRLVYGGASVGLMGHLARSVKKHGGHITGVIPQHMGEIEFEFEGSDVLVRTPCIRTRKAEMEARSDAFVVLPGGIGTLEEVFEVLTLRLLERHAKPIVFVNVDGFYDGLFAFLKHLHDTRFNRAATREHYHVAATPAQAIEMATR